MTPTLPALLAVLVLASGGSGAGGAGTSSVAAEPSGSEPNGPEPAGPGPTGPELDRAIAALATELPRAGGSAQRAALAKRLADAHVLRARRALAEGRRDAALDDYDRALALVPSHPYALAEAGWVHLEAGRPERARGFAETALAYDLDNAAARVLRGEVLYRDERLDDALEDFEAAAARRPDDADLRARIEKVRRELAAQRDFRRADSSHFTLLFDGAGDAALRTLLLDALERALDDLRGEIDPGPIPPLSVIAYTREAFNATTGAGNEVGGLFDGKIRLPAGGVTAPSAALERVVRHELVHALLHARGRGEVPRWLHEGLAQLLEPRDLARSLAALRAARDAGGDPAAAFSYPSAHAFTVFLDREYSRSRLLWYVDLLGERTPEPEAFERAFGVSRAGALDGYRRWLAAAAP